MANPIQAIRTVYDIAKNARDNGAPLSDEEIKLFLKRTTSDESIISKYPRFQKGYAAEDLFMRIYSLMPWVKVVTPLGQEQFPEKSKQELQVPDYEILFEAGNNINTSNILIEVKLIDGDKQTFKLEKYKYNVLKEYSAQMKKPLLYALFWRKKLVWTINSIESFSEKSSVYHISFENAYKDDLSAIFGDYTYVFNNQCHRKSRFSSDLSVNSELIHFHEKYGRAVSESLSVDGKEEYQSLNLFETAVLDCAFDFEEISHTNVSNTITELYEQLEKTPYIYKSSFLLLKYLLKIYLYDNNDMYCEANPVVKDTFNIVDTVRQKCGSKRYYLMPYHINETGTKLIDLQFGNVPHIFNTYLNAPRTDNYVILASHDQI